MDALARDLLQRIERRQHLVRLIRHRCIVAGAAGQRHRCGGAIANGRTGAQDLRAHRRLVGGTFRSRNANRTAEAATAGTVLFRTRTVGQLVLVKVHDREFTGPIVQPVDDRRGEALALVVAGQAGGEATTLRVRVHLRIQAVGERATGQRRVRRFPVLVAGRRLEAEYVAR